jgi:membrane-bound inhibitor of C-type lysozyme
MFLDIGRRDWSNFHFFPAKCHTGDINVTLVTTMSPPPSIAFLCSFGDSLSEEKFPNLADLSRLEHGLRWVESSQVKSNSAGSHFTKSRLDFWSRGNTALD